MPKFAPATVTEVPIAPEVGLRELIFGGTVTVKEAPLLASPPTVTTTLPDVAPVGTGAMMLDVDQLDGVATVPLNITELEP